MFSHFREANVSQPSQMHVRAYYSVKIRPSPFIRNTFLHISWCELCFNPILQRDDCCNWNRDGAAEAPVLSTHPPYTNGYLNGHTANVWVDFCHLQSVRLNIHLRLYWFSNASPDWLGVWKHYIKTTNQEFRTSRNRQCLTQSHLEM